MQYKNPSYTSNSKQFSHPIIFLRNVLNERVPNYDKNIEYLISIIAGEKRKAYLTEIHLIIEKIELPSYSFVEYSICFADLFPSNWKKFWREKILPTSNEEICYQFLTSALKTYRLNSLGGRPYIEDLTEFKNYLNFRKPIDFLKYQQLKILK